jgi:raffinose/stachyose/melibiose transport system substrate-binding protein
MKRLISLTLTLLLALSLLTGSLPGALAEAATADHPKTITFWHTWGAANHPNKPIVDEVVAFLEDKYDITIEQDSTDFESYKIKLATAYAAGEAPDIARGWSLGFMQPFVEGGKLLALDEYMTDYFKAKMLPGTTDNMTFDGKVYGLPMGITTPALFVNRPMFEEAGLELPTDWDKLVTAVKYFKEKGVVPMALGAKDYSTLGIYYDSIQLRAAGPEAVTNALMKKTDYSAPEFLEGVNKLKELIDLGAFSPAAAGMSRDESEVDVFNGKIPMYFHGNWVVAQYYMDSSSVNPDDIEILPMPAWDGAASDTSSIIGGVGDAFYVNADTEYPEFMTMVMQDMCYAFAKGIYERGTGLPAYTISEADTADMKPLFKKMVEYTGKATSLTNATDFVLTGVDVEQFYQSLQSLLIGAITPEQYIENMNAINQNT